MWHFWIDVGGTFTDCLARRPDGALVRQKVLSSAVTKGRCAAGSEQQTILDPARSRDPEGFWTGYRLTLSDASGQPIATRTIVRFDRASGRLELDAPLDAAAQSGCAYEIAGDEEAPLLAIRLLLGLPRKQPIPPSVVRLGTTRGTNALLTRTGARTALVTTRGFADILRIGNQNRPKLFALDIEKPTPLFAESCEIDERIAADGTVLVPLDAAQCRAALVDLKARGFESIAICFLHAALFPAHEVLAKTIAADVGWTSISISSEVAPLVKIVSRGDTTVLDAYLNPVLAAYVARLRTSLAGSDLRIMTSAGGLVAADRFTGKDSILSGPAGGVVGYARAAELAGFQQAIGFDMGGTSTDVSRFDHGWQYEFETEKAGVRVVAPMLAIETVAAGGGSICRFDGVKLVVGPESAGANPGPACYGRGGPLTVTDLNCFLGKLLPERFPFPLDHAAVERRLTALAEEVAQHTGQSLSLVALAEGLVRVANANMVRPIRAISVAKGYDPRDYILVAFGGAAGQHACAIAAELDMREVLIHPDAGILSAVGIGLADIRRHREQGIYRLESPEAWRHVEHVFARLAEEAIAEVEAEGIARERIEVQKRVDLRYQGIDAYLSIAEPPSDDYRQAYEDEHERLYGYRRSGRAVEIVAARIEVIGRTPEFILPAQPCVPRAATPLSTRPIWFDGSECQAAIYEREQLAPGDRLAGPAVIAEAVATTVIDPGWQAEVLGRGELLVTRASDGEAVPRGESQPAAAGVPDAAGVPIATDDPSAAGDPSPPSDYDTPDPILLEIFNNQFAGIADEMGITLRNTASSVNVKERLDFSCALFTPRGELVVNAPHIPVHLGAMGLTVRALIEDVPHLEPGDVYVTNDPYRGGSHLPDVTVITPVHDPATRRLLFFTASRAHHAEIGGIVPGSMPPFSRTLAEEGVLIRNFRLIAAGRERLDEFRTLLLSGEFPTRSVNDNLADVQAQAAANQQGARMLLEMIERSGRAIVEAYMRHIQAAAARKMRLALARFPQGRHAFADALDDGTPICVAITIAADQAKIDFTGTGPVSSGNLNANRAIVTAAVMYCLRLLIDEDIPLNEGVLEPIELVIPEGLLNPPPGATAAECPAIVGGNVETSQRVVDVLLGALGLAAASQGTMNNFVFGDDTFGYYETICGGAGGTERACGADAVHTHMTNTRLTDPEVLERRYPVRLVRFSIRTGSGGDGQHSGGCGVIREIEFLRRVQVALLTQRRGPFPPYGLAGGSPGSLGRNTWLHARGGASETPQAEELTGRVQFTVEPGDRVRIETPGGGGYGAASE